MVRPPEQHRRRQGDPALSSGSSWFPRPSSVDDVEVVQNSGGLDAKALFGLLVAGGAEEWPHKVGVAGRADGSGKATTRLLASSGWILKTNIADVVVDREAAQAMIAAARDIGDRAGAWHPSKWWALLRTTDGWLPISACAELRTLRTFDRLLDRVEGWTRMLEFGLEVHRRCGLGVDLNPANFGVESASPRTLFYLDDEFYPTFELRQIAYAIAARIPEEPDAPESTWRGLGRSVRRVLEARGVDRAGIEEIVDGLSDYPLAEAFHAKRTALTGVMREERTPMPRAVAARTPEHRVCVLADVHANLPALEAVLAAAKEMGAASFLFLGDAVGYGPHPRECVEKLATLPSATCIRGNHDHAIGSGRLEVGMNRLARSTAEWTRTRLGEAELTWLSQLAPEHRGHGWLAVHGAPRDPNRFFAYVYDLTYEENLAQLDIEGVSLCFHGHTHVPLVHVTLPSGPAKLPGAGEIVLSPQCSYLINPGSVGQPRDGDPRAAFAIWDRATQRIAFQRVAYRLDRTLRDIESAGLPAELLTRLQQGS